MVNVQFFNALIAVYFVAILAYAVCSCGKSRRERNLRRDIQQRVSEWRCGDYDRQRRM